MSDLCVCKDLWVWGDVPPGNQKLDALRLLLRPFWGRSRAAVATWLTEYCIQVLTVYAFALKAS